MHTLGLFIFQEVGFDVISIWGSSSFVFKAVVIVVGLALLSLLCVAIVRFGRGSANRS
jgi:hypothetical protein